MAAMTPTEIVAHLRGREGGDIDFAVADCLRGETDDAELLNTRARLVTLLRENVLWPPSERYRHE